MTLFSLLLLFLLFQNVSSEEEESVKEIVCVHLDYDWDEMILSLSVDANTTSAGRMTLVHHDDQGVTAAYLCYTTDPNGGYCSLAHHIARSPALMDIDGYVRFRVHAWGYVEILINEFKCFRSQELE